MAFEPVALHRCRGLSLVLKHHKFEVQLKNTRNGLKLLRVSQSAVSLRQAPGVVSVNLAENASARKAREVREVRETEKLIKKGATEKLEFDDIQDLIVSPPSASPNKAPTPTRESPTLLEREALAVEGSAYFSRRERNEAMYGLLDVLEQKGVTPGYAFEFVRHAENLIDVLIAEAKEIPGEEGLGSLDQTLKGIDDALYVDKGRTEQMTKTQKPRKLEGLDLNNRLLDTVRKARGLYTEQERGHWKGSLSSRVSLCAEQQGLARLVFYFQMIGIKAVDIPKLLPYVGRRIDVVMAKVEFLRSICVRYG